MKKINLIIILLISCINLFGQNKIDKDGNRKGNWIITYEKTKNITFDPLGAVLNIEKSLDEIDVEKSKSLSEYYFEQCRYKDGNKNGQYAIYHWNGKYSNLYVTGYYKNGKKDGIQKNLIYSGSISPDTLKIKYSENNIIDQTVEFFEKYRSEVKCKLKFKNGVLSTFYLADNGQKYLSNTSDSKTKVLRYNYNSDKNIYIGEIEDKKWKRFDVETYYFMKTGIALSENMEKLDVESVFNLNNYNPIEIINYKNGKKNGVYKKYYSDGKLNVSYTFKDDKLDGPAEIYVSNVDNYLFSFPKEISNGLEYYQDGPSWTDQQTKVKDVLTLIHKKESSYAYPLVVLIKSIKEHKKEYTPEDITEYFKMSDLYFTYDSVKKLSYVNDYTIYYNNKPILQRIIKDGDKGFKIFDKDGTVLMDNNKLENENIQAVQKANERLNQVLESDKSCFWCSKKVKVKDGVLLEICRCYNEKTKQNESFSTSPKFFCTNKCMYDAEKQCCSDNNLIKR